MNVYCITQKFDDKVVAGKLFEATTDGDALRAISMSFRDVEPSLRPIMQSSSLCRVGSFDEDSIKLAAEKKPVIVKADLSVLVHPGIVVKESITARFFNKFQNG